MMFDSGKTVKLKAAKDKEICLFIRDKQNQEIIELPGTLEDISTSNGLLNYVRYKKKKDGLSVVLYVVGSKYEITKIEDAASQEVLYAGI